MKVIFNLTFHHQLEQTKFYLNNILNWKILKQNEIVICCAHKENLLQIKQFIDEKYKDIKATFIFVTPDLGYHKGTFQNVRTGLYYIKNNLQYDYIVNIEGDNMFWNESKLTSIINKMKELNKEFLIIPEGKPTQKNYKNLLRNTWPDKINRAYFHFTTLNVFSKNFIDNIYPFEINEKYYNLGWCSQEGTPYEAFVSLCLRDKMNLNSEEEELNFYLSKGLYLFYDLNKIIFNGFYDPDDQVPDKFIQWGIVNCLATGRGPWEKVIDFIKLHSPYITNEVNFI